MAPNSAERAPGYEHIPDFPRGWNILQCLQFVFSVAAIGLLGYSLHVWPSAGAIVAVVVSILTIIVSSWLILSYQRFPLAFNYWASIALNLVLWVGWGIASVWCISEVVLMNTVRSYYCNGDSGSLSYLPHRPYSRYRPDYSDDYGTGYYDDSDITSFVCDTAVRQAHVAVKIALTFFVTSECLMFLLAWIGDAVVISRHRQQGLGNWPVEAVRPTINRV